MRPFWTVFLFLLFIQLGEAKPLILKEGGKPFHELGLYIDILEDPTGKLKIADVTGPKWAPKFKASTKIVHNLGFSQSSFWARIHIQNQNPYQSTWLLSQNYYQQDIVKFYSSNPAERFGINHLMGSISPGLSANITILDMNKTHYYNSDQQFSHAKSSDVLCSGKKFS